MTEALTVQFKEHHREAAQYFFNRALVCVDAMRSQHMPFSGDNFAREDFDKAIENLERVLGL